MWWIHIFFVLYWPTVVCCDIVGFMSCLIKSLFYVFSECLKKKSCNTWSLVLSRCTADQPSSLICTSCRRTSGWALTLFVNAVYTESPPWTMLWRYTKSQIGWNDEIIFYIPKPWHHSLYWKQISEELIGQMANQWLWFVPTLKSWRLYQSSVLTVGDMCEASMFEIL